MHKQTTVTISLLAIYLQITVTQVTPSESDASGLFTWLYLNCIICKCMKLYCL